MIKKNRNKSPVKKSLNKPTPQISISGQQFSGPLPPPEMLSQYNAIIPSLAENIVQMAQDESKHRRLIEQKTLQTNIDISNFNSSERKRGQIFGFAIGMTGLVVSSFMAYIGAEIASAFVGGSTVVGLVSIFVIGQIYHKKSN